MRRRAFLGRGIAGVLGLAACRTIARRDRAALRWHDALRVESQHRVVRPLDVIRIATTQPGTLVAIDGEGREYARKEIRGEARLEVGGALGSHHALLLDESGRLVDDATFIVDASTAIHDGARQMHALFDLARHTLRVDHDRLERDVRIDGREYRPLVYWLRDHVLTLEGARWLRGGLASGVDLYADLQREDGMIWDNVEPRPNAEPTWWQARFAYGDFIRAVDGGRWECKRIPVTNDVEALFVDGIHLTWQATDDAEWMADKLPAAERALEYSMRDPYRWSDRHHLLKRGFSIDQWDFVSELDAARTGDAMAIEPGKSDLGVHFGDNVLYAHACRRLADMLEAAGRPDDAPKWRTRADQIARRTDALAWAGTHYLHHVPEDPNVQRDLGVDERTQVSLGNAYALARGIRTEHATAIVRTYQGLAQNLPAGSPGEWYSIVPPFPRGFSRHAAPWEYVNGGVLPIVAGKLALGAMTHGHERYGVDVLRRVAKLAELSDGVLEGAYRGAAAQAPARTFTPIDLRALVDEPWPPRDATERGEPFAAESGAFAGIDFALVDAKALVLHSGQRVALPVRGRFASLYLLHEAEGDLAGAIELLYADGTRERLAIDRRHFGDWWHEPVVRWPLHRPPCRRVFRSDDMRRFCTVWAAGVDNPRPDRLVRGVELFAAPAGKPWRILAVSSCDAPTFFDPGPVSYGIPVGWGGSAVARALIEGLAGVEDRGAGLRDVAIVPRWAAADEPHADVCARYGDSRGYVRYRYRFDPVRARLRLQFTGSADAFVVRVLLPDGFVPTSAELDGATTPLELSPDATTGSRYAVATATGSAVHSLTLAGRPSSRP